MKLLVLYGCCVLAACLQINCVRVTDDSSKPLSSLHGAAVDLEAGDRALVVVEDSAVDPSLSINNIVEARIPVIRLVFNCTAEDWQRGACSIDSTTIELSGEIVGHTSDYWRDSLEYRRKFVTDTFRDAVSEAETTTSFWNRSRDFADLLSASNIKSPNGTRLISEAESWAVIQELNRKASGLIERLSIQ